MASALVALKNAVAVFTVAGSGTRVDPETGNVLATDETVSYDLFLRRGGAQDANYPGVDVETANYDGYCIAPQALDARIRPGTTCMLSFASDAPRECVVVDARYSYGTTGLLGQTLQQVLGDKIRLAGSEQQ